MLKQIRKIGAAFAAVLALAGFMQFGVSAEVKEGAVNDEINWAYDTEAKTLTLSGTGALPEKAYLFCIKFYNSLTKHTFFDKPLQNIRSCGIVLLKVVWLLLKPFHNYKYLNKTKEVVRWDFGVL